MKIIVWQSSLKKRAIFHQWMEWMSGSWVTTVLLCQIWNYTGIIILFWLSILSIHLIAVIVVIVPFVCYSRTVTETGRQHQIIIDISTTICIFRAETYHVENLILCLVHSAILWREGKREKEEENMRWRKYQCEHPHSSSNISLLQI